VIRKKITPVIEKRLSEMKKLGDNYVPPVNFYIKYFLKQEIILKLLTHFFTLY